MKSRDHKYSKLTAEFFGKILACRKMTQFVHLSIATAFFSGLAHYFFFIFCMKLRDHKYSKLTAQFLGGNSCLLKSRPKMLKMARFACLSVTTALFLVIFCMNLRDHKYSKLKELNFLEKFLLVQKRAKKVQIDLFFLPLWQHIFFFQDWLIRFASCFA